MNHEEIKNSFIKERELMPSGTLMVIDYPGHVLYKHEAKVIDHRIITMGAIYDYLLVTKNGHNVALDKGCLKPFESPKPATDEPKH